MVGAGLDDAAALGVGPGVPTLADIEPPAPPHAAITATPAIAPEYPQAELDVFIGLPVLLGTLVIASSISADVVQVPA